MTRKYRLLAGILSLCLLLTAAGCSRNPDDPSWNANQGNSNNPGEVQPGTDDLPPTDPVPEETEPTKEGVSLTFNQAVQLFENLSSYTMTGSVSSTSTIGEVSSTVVTTIDCQYEKKNDGTVHMIMDSNQYFNNTVFAHCTYYTAAPEEDPYYYIDTLGTKYFVRTNDFGDYAANHYLKQVDESKLEKLEVQSLTAENQTQFGFEIPFEAYQSEALYGILGGFVDDSLASRPVRIRAVIGADGTLQSLFIALENTTAFGGDTVVQEVIASLTFLNCGFTTVVPPADLDAYEDRTVHEGGGQNPDGETVPYNPGDFD